MQKNDKKEMIVKLLSIYLSVYFSAMAEATICALTYLSDRNYF